MREMTSAQKIQAFNESNAPFYLVDHKDEVSLCCVFHPMPDSVFSLGQEAFNRYAERIGDPVKDEYGLYTHGSGYEWEHVCDSVADFVDRNCTPNMLIKLRQGVGRLIRCESDTGTVSILDPRAASKSYAAKINHALHKYPRVYSTEEIECFMRSVKHESYYAEKKEK